MSSFAYKRVGSVEQYLRVYAEPEAGLALRLAEPFERALVVPVCGESADFLDGYTRAFQSARGATLCIVVVNGARDADADVHAVNQRCFEELLERLIEPTALAEQPALWWGRLRSAPTASLLVVDRQSVRARLPEKQGVGLARRIGSDIALALYGARQLRSPWIATSDADVVLPDAYFSVLERCPPDAVAVLYPFEHVPGGAPDVDRASVLYEIFLRYYVLGLAHAGSPYAFHTIGSTLALREDAYAAVRGFPKRNAGEDFYVLNKLAKVGPVLRPAASPIQIRSRLSARVPFGTGRAVTRICAEQAEQRDLTLYDPRTFDVLSALFACFAEFARSRDLLRAERLLEPAGTARAALGRFLDALSAREVLAEAARESSAESALWRRLHTWFDAFRTLKLVHALRDEVFPEVPWQVALSTAPFALAEEPGRAEEPVLAGCALIERELALRSRVGPTLPRAGV
jgi:hypothetical protein